MQSFKLIILLGMVLLSYSAKADDAVHIGSATAVVNEVFTVTNAGESKLKLNDAVFFKQQVMTKENSNLTVTFRDNSTFSIAPSSQVVLDEFVFNPSENVLEKTINVVKGSFRYISGFPIKGSNTKIVTPFGTAGIRGSAVQGTMSSQSGLTLNVGSGSVQFTTSDGQSSTVNEGESLTISPKCNAVPNVPMSGIADAMQLIENNFSSVAVSPLSSQQSLANAAMNTLSVAEQRRAYRSAQSSTVKPPVNGKSSVFTPKPVMQSNPEEVIEKLIQALQNKNKQQVDVAVQDIISTALINRLNEDALLNISLNALSGAKTNQQLHIAAMILNTLEKLNPSVATQLAGKIQQALSTQDQSELPSLVPNVVFPLSSSSHLIR